MKDKSKYTGNELKYIKRVLKSGKLNSTSGDVTYEFEQKFAKEFGAKYAIACNSGTAALHMALEGVGVGYGDEVIVPALSVIMNTTSVLHCNAVPVYADVDEKTFTMDPDDVKRKIGPNTKAIVAVSLYGFPSNVKELQDACLGVPIIEDNAEHLGNLRTAAATYSLEGTKHLSAGEMGVVLTDNENVALRSRLLANHGFKTTKADNGKTKSDVNVFQDPDFERHITVGWNYRTSEFTSAIALAQLERKEEILERRRMYAWVLYNVFDGRKKFICQQYHPNHSFWTFAVRFLGGKDAWRELHRKFVEAGGDGFWSAWRLQYQEPVMRGGVFVDRCLGVYSPFTGVFGCPVAEKIQPQIIQFKLNYRDKRLFLRQVKILERVLREF